MQQRYEQFLEHPTGARYLELRSLLLEQFDVPQALELHELEHEIHRGGDTDAIECHIDRLSAQWMLSPKFHRLLARFAERQGDPQPCELSLLEAQSCLDGLLATGDGSPERPYMSTYPTDVHDVAAARMLRVDAQHLVRRQSHWFDLATCGDREIWFARPLQPVAQDSDPVHLRLSNP